MKELYPLISCLASSKSCCKNERISKLWSWVPHLTQRGSRTTSRELHFSTYQAECTLWKYFTLLNQSLITFLQQLELWCRFILQKHLVTSFCSWLEKRRSSRPAGKLKMNAGSLLRMLLGRWWSSPYTVLFLHNSNRGFSIRLLDLIERGFQEENALSRPISPRLLWPLTVSSML